ncbi:hypothetical protein [Methylovulum psychrotolerans]|uniref:Uncharacterized protein n=1 Tax=Methylovulum psychrotolerans TaxID=1704499 RepID=A0A2S5CL89_9GAMM|nr:hypothetical protein [Methylovulum psychrotolerans]POZ51558.1 hypothetical protein AADEFJLK_02425 [Methylovulum psychrotolerans]
MLYNLVSGEKWDSLDSKKKEQHFRSYFSIGRNENTLNWARHASGVLAGTSNTRSIGNGVIGLTRYGSEIIESIISDLSVNEQIPIIAFSIINIADTKAKTHASIFNILGIIVRFFSIEENFPADLSINHKKARITNELRQLLSVVTISGMPWQEGIHNTEDSNQSSYSTPDISNLNLDTLADSIIDWLERSKNLKNEIRPSAVFLGKVWTRLYFSLLSVSDIRYSQKRNNGLATIMELFACCLINAFFAEESYYHFTSKIETGVDRINPNDSPDNFIEKIKTHKDNMEQFPFTQIIGTCPIVLGLIKNKNALHILEAMNIKSKKDCNIGCNELIFNKLNKEIIVNAEKKTS